MDSSPRFTRGLPAGQAGTSVIVALVFAAILGAVALSLNALHTGSSSNAALSAATVAAVPANNIATPSQQTPAQIQQACTQTINKAVGNVASSITVNRYPLSEQGNIKDSCIAAILTYPSDDNSVSLSTLEGSAANYKCVGRSVAIFPTEDGKTLTVQSDPNSDLAPGVCKTRTCDANLENCKIAQSNGVNGINYSAADTAAGTNPGPAPAASTNTGTVLPDNAMATQGCSIGSSAGNSATYNCDNLSDAQTQADQLNRSGYDCALNADQNAVTCTTPGPLGPDITYNPQTVATPGCTAGTPTANSTTYSCGSAQDAQNQLNQLLYSGASGCQLGADQKSVVCTTTAPSPGPCQSGQVMSATGCAPQTQPPPVPQPQLCDPACTTGQQCTNGVCTLVQPQQPCAQSQYIGGNSLAPCSQQQQAHPLQQPQAQQPLAANSTACPTPPTQPQCASGATAMPISASGNGCTTSYQCVPTSSTIGQTPTPQISCSPQIADVGQPVAITYSCQNATGSSGSGFSTGNQTSGTASATLQAPPDGTTANTATFGLTCSGSGQTATAQCSVQINTPAIDLVADPRSVQSGETASIGWVTAGMQSCVVSSPQDVNFTQQNANSTNVNGVAQTDPIITNTEFDLTCQTLGGQTKSASTTVTVGGTSPSASGNITVASTADGQTVNHGDQVTISWNAPNAQANTAVALWLIDVQTEQATALIAGDEPASSTYAWTIPASGSSCDQNSYQVCAQNLVAGDSYGIEAALYTPQNAELSPDATAAQAPTYVAYGYTPDVFMVGQ